MAIDTVSKRRSALGRWVLPAPDGTIGQADRQHKVWKYAGILSTSVTVIAGPFRVVARQTFSPGSRESETFQPGAVAADVISPGSVQGEGNP